MRMQSFSDESVCQLENDKLKLEAEQKQKQNGDSWQSERIGETIKWKENSHDSCKTTPNRAYIAVPRSIGLGNMCMIQCLLDISILFNFIFNPSPALTDQKSEICRYEVAELVNVCWLEILARLYTNDLTPNTTYAAYLVFKLTDNHKGLYNPPSKASIRFLRAGEASNRDVLLVGQGHRHDGWMEVELGLRGNDNDYLEIFLIEIEGGQCKRGLMVRGMEVRPK
ncbi:unnamed protein product [Rhodiola kirilowii]